MNLSIETVHIANRDRRMSAAHQSTFLMAKDLGRRRSSVDVSRHQISDSLITTAVPTSVKLPKLSPVRLSNRRHSAPYTFLGNITTLPTRALSGIDAVNENLYGVNTRKFALDKRRERFRIQEERSRADAIMPHRRKTSMPSIDDIIPSIGKASGNVPLNSQRRILQRNNSVYLIYKYLVDTRESLSTEVQLEIEKLKHTNS
ncbi:uncharacterized protein LOC117332967 [Pecten maximus]|uniref:uncharacterized protein LOC117332967 n=1 Tax=Pecten maximus TaxID=6579 RepID=UPI0014581820|nr:uncharacterized protein LOC117332967 [Pecten maximus]